MWDASDEALLAGFATGDPTAEAVFVRRFQRRVHGLALTVVGDEGEAADVAQEAFVRAWRHAGAYDPRRGAVHTWLLTITRNLAVDHLRRRGARPVDHVDPTTLVLTSPAFGPDDAAVRTDEVDRSVTALRALPDEQRRALALAALGGRTASEISELEGIPLGTAKTRIRTALGRVREHLAEQEADHG
ncbi:MAG: sigma-70 family RNA polymerase sigma factor [Acidimicrobiales bacterium]|nr:sigma-70 family RNA polymerase sigma factor [Acidimicrobiales bacterium]